MSRHEFQIGDFDHAVGWDDVGAFLGERRCGDVYAV